MLPAPFPNAGDDVVFTQYVGLPKRSVMTNGTEHESVQVGTLYLCTVCPALSGDKADRATAFGLCKRQVRECHVS